MRAFTPWLACWLVPAPTDGGGGDGGGGNAGRTIGIVVGVVGAVLLGAGVGYACVARRRKFDYDRGQIRV